MKLKGKDKDGIEWEYISLPDGNVVKRRVSGESKKREQEKEGTGLTPAALGALFRGDTENFMAAAVPGGIEKQEKEGQEQFVKEMTLPRNCLNVMEMKRSYPDALEQLGFKVCGNSSDELFMVVVFPKGWKKIATDHSMWSNLVDDKGRVRARVFYKAAFYDRSAHIQFLRRYENDADTEKGTSKDYPYREAWKEPWVGVVIDQATNERIFMTQAVKPKDDDDRSRVQAELSAKASDWLDEHFPEWTNTFAYWD